ncbi:ras-like protein family member 12 isoform X3 [Taeniopygia guttata]|uniref:ras-like protein family member 12 isoform X3 n=1 Tax=Taeniopygia guttata TaxID=59729 RepID=UPI003BB97A54
MSSPASDRTEGPGLGCWGHGEELRAHESPGTWRGGHQAEAPQVSLPEAGGARGAGVCSAGGTVLGVAGAACPAPRRGSFPYKEFGWSPSSGSRARLRLPHSSQPRPCGGRCCPGPALTESPASPPALACKDRGCPRCSANPETAASGRPRVPSPSATWPSWGAEGPASQVRRAGQGIGELPGTGHLPHLPLSPPVALTVKFLTKRFISEYDPNLEDTYSSEELVDQQPVLLKVMDTADQDGPRNCERYLCWASAFLVVYSIDNRKSFEGCQRYLEVLALHARGCQRRCPVLLLGNKLDMEQYRQVLSAEGMSLASRFGCLFHEVSACQDFSRVQHVFHEAVREVRRQAEWNLPVQPLFISEERPCPPVATPVALPTHHSLATCTFNTLSPVNYKEIPSVAQAKLVTVKSSRAQSKRKAPTLTLLKGFKIF